MKFEIVWHGTVFLLGCVLTISTVAVAAPVASEPRSDALSDPVRPGDAGPVAGGTAPDGLDRDPGNLVPSSVYQELVAPPSGADLHEEPPGISGLLGNQSFLPTPTPEKDRHQKSIGRQIVSDPAPLEQIDTASSSPVLDPLLWLVSAVLLVCVAMWTWSRRSERQRAEQLSERVLTSQPVPTETEAPPRSKRISGRNRFVH
jgi:hypothetical protein